MKGSEFEGIVVQHVLDRLVAEIEQGNWSTIAYTINNSDGTYSVQNREVNVQHKLVSAVIQKLTEDNGQIKAIYDKLQKIIETEEFKNQISEKFAEKMISWLNEKAGWYNDEGYKNRAAFNRDVRTEVIKQIAKRKVDRIMEEAESIGEEEVKE